MLPLDFKELEPDCTVILPPLPELTLSPAWMFTSPPAPVLPLPTINDIIANNRNTNVLTNQLNFNLVESFSEGGRVGMQQGGPITEEDVVIQIWLAEPEAVKRIHKYDYNNYYQSGEWVSKIRNEEIPTQSNTNPVVRSNIEPSNVQLAASGTNQALSKPYDQLSSIEKEQILFNRA